MAVARSGQRQMGSSTPDAEELLRALGLIMGFGTPIALLAVAAGVPLYWYLRQPPTSGAEPRTNPLPGARGWVAIAAGAGIGGFAAMLLAPSLRGDLISIPLPVWEGALLGLASAATFVARVRQRH